MCEKQDGRTMHPSLLAVPLCVFIQIFIFHSLTFAARHGGAVGNERDGVGRLTDCLAVLLLLPLLGACYCQPVVPGTTTKGDVTLVPLRSARLGWLGLSLVKYANERVEVFFMASFIIPFISDKGY